MILLEENISKKVPGEYSLFIHSNYNEQLVNFLRKNKINFYHKQEKIWETPITELTNIIDNFSDELQIKLLDHTHKNIVSNEDAEELLKPYIKSKLFQYQIEGVTHGLNNKKFFLADDQGLGKSLQTISIAVLNKILHNYQHCLIVCCVNTLKWNWASEIKKHSNLNFHVIGSKKTRDDKLSVGSVKDRVDDILKPTDDYFLITNVETLRDKDFVNALLHGPNKIDMLVVDEIHRLRQPTSSQSEGLLALKNCEYILPLSGTLIMNKPENAYVPLNLIGVEHCSYTKFKEYFSIYSDFSKYVVTGYKNLSVLRQSVENHMLRRMKGDVLDLPPKMYSTEYVEMSTRQKKIYDEVRQDLIQNIDRVKISSDPLGQLIRLRQATGYTGILSTEIKESAKIDRLLELLEDITESGNKALVISNWTSITDIVLDKTRQLYNSAYITGQVKDSQRELEIEKFQNDITCKICIGTIGAMGTGLTLTAASYVIFLDSPWTKADKLQAEDRAHRIGTKGTVNIITLVTKNTIDEKIEELVEKKGTVTDYLIDGKVDKEKNADLVKYLLDI